MKRLAFFSGLMALALTLAGCGHKHEEGDGHAHGDDHEEHGHEHGEESPGASFTPGKGLTLPPETQQALGLKTAPAREQILPTQLRFNLQVFGEKHHPTVHDEDHTGCDVHGSGFLPNTTATAVRPGQLVQIQTRTNELLSGVVVQIGKALGLDEAEIIVGVTNAAAKLKPGDFLTATITLPRTNAVTAIPRSALLRTVEGTFVYRVMENTFARTAVVAGEEADGQWEIRSGVQPGDVVVTHPVENLWLIELRATKGGGHSH